ncbi:complement C1q-like protein 2 [Mercenaria mercenaria]|uniref:complement C1q-like protein 2 n=1 Tax=Mercenaria mercenaria TaxID=6596 RepID=UPI00234F69A3|nr:complement C1q-like protein 2 [Mercenaria mercenaria]
MAFFWIEIAVLSLLLVIGSNGVKESVDGLSNSETQSLLQIIISEVKQRERLAVKVEELQDKNRVVEAQLNNLTAETSNNKRQVAFSGRIGRHIPLSEKGEVVKFGVVTTNIGNAYSTTTGIFRCPVAGLYLFSCNVLGDKIGWVTLYVYKNGVQIARPYTGVGIKEHESGSDSAVVHAEAGDEIYSTDIGGTSAYLDTMSRFSGVLLNAD